jgi:NAD(P)-dependent dehydrogenase (short-subunit alcohol dehydrogenase family)
MITSSTTATTNAADHGARPRVTIVTGASSGIGRAIAGRLVAAGDQVYAFSRSPTEGRGITSIAVDVRDMVTIEAGVRQVLHSAGRIDALVNAAGVSLFGAAEEATPEQAHALFETNFFGVVRMTNAVLPTFRAQRAGRIINISSVLGFMPAPFLALYAASKHAIEGYTESLDHEIRGLGIRAISIEPGFTRTALGQHGVRSTHHIQDYSTDLRAVGQAIEDALRNGMDPDLVARRVQEALDTASPALHYPASPEDVRLRRLRRFVPSKLFDRSLRRQFRLGATPHHINIP